MKFLSSTRIAAVILLLIAPAFSLHAQNHIIGKWLSEDEEGVTEIYKQGDKFFGKITWLKKPNNVNGKAFTDTENPEKSLRSRMLLGLFILQGFDYLDKEWKNGTIYDPKTGRTYRCTMWLNNDNILKVRGYWGAFYQTQKWSRVK